MTLFTVQNRVSVFWKVALFLFYSQNPEIALSYSKAAEFYCDNLNNFFKTHGFELQLFGYKTAKFQTSEQKSARVRTSSVS